MAKIIRLSAPGASGAAGGGSSPSSLQITLTNGQGQQGIPFSGALAGTGGVLPYTFSIVSGSLPSGLSLNSATGRISGTPAAAGSTAFTGRVTDSASTTADLATGINVAMASGTARPVGISTLPSATDVTSITVSAVGPDANFPYNQNSGRGNYFSIGSISYSDAGCITDANAAFFRLTAQDLDINHNPIGPEQPFAGTPVGAAGATHFVGPLEGAYGTDGYSYTRSGELAYVRIKGYVINFLDGTAYSFANAAASTLQTSIGSGAGYVDIPVALTTLDGRRQPRGGITTRNINPHDLGNGTQQHPDTGALVVPNANAGASYIPDSSFSYSTPGTIGSGGLLPSWGYGLGMTSTVEVKNDGGNSEANYVRLTNGDASISSTISVQPGLQFYIQLAARSSNTGGAAHALGLYVRWQDSNFNWLTPFTTIVGTVSGYVASWTNPAISGYITAPSGAAWGVIQISTAFAEPGYWDVDDVFVQAVIQQTGNSTTTSTYPSIYSGDHGAITTTSLTDSSSSFYGKNYALLVAPNGTDLVVLSTTSGSTGAQVVSTGGQTSIYASSTGGGIQATRTSPANAVTLDAATPSIQVKIGGTTYTGINGTIQDNLGVNHTVKCGLIVT